MQAFVQGIGEWIAPVIGPRILVSVSWYHGQIKYKDMGTANDNNTFEAISYYAFFDT